MLSSATTAPTLLPPSFSLLSTVASQLRPPFWKNSPTSPTQTGPYFPASPGGWSCSLHNGKDYWATPLHPQLLLIAAANLSISASFLSPACISHILLVEAPGPEGWVGDHCACYARAEGGLLGSNFTQVSPCGQAHPCLFTSSSTRAGLHLSPLLLTMK